MNIDIMIQFWQLLLYSCVLSCTSGLLGAFLASLGNGAHGHHCDGCTCYEDDDIGELNPPTPPDSPWWGGMTLEEIRERDGIPVWGRGGEIVDVILADWRV